METAEPLMEEAVGRYLDVGATWNAAMLLTYWSAIPRHQGDYGRAYQITKQALGLAQQQGDWVTMYSALFNLASIAQAQGDYNEALSQFRQAMVLAVEVGDNGNIISCLKAIAELVAAQGDIAYAIRLWGATDALLEGSDAAVYTYAPDQEQVAKVIESAQNLLSDEEWAALWEEGRAFNLEQALHLALDVDPAPLK